LFSATKSAQNSEQAFTNRSPILSFQKSKGCSQCCEGTLTLKNFIQESGAQETARPESRAFYECEKCGFRVKEFIDGRTEIADDDEWSRFCE
jgi:hypothetical protein